MALNDTETELDEVAETFPLVEPCPKTVPVPFGPLNTVTKKVSVPMGAVTTGEHVPAQATVVAVPPLTLTLADWVPDGPTILTVTLAVVGGDGMVPPPLVLGVTPPPPPPPQAQRSEKATVISAAREAVNIGHL